MSERLVVFGGTFDPIHLGHIALCQTACDFVDADRILLVPTIPPYKQNTRIAPAADRLFMCQLAAREYPNITVDDCEIQKGEPAYTAETIRSIRKKYPEDVLYYLVGSDAFQNFHYWKNWRIIGEEAILLVGLRGDEEKERVLAERDYLEKEGIHVILMDNQPVVISATEIRRKIKTDEIEKYLHPDVLKYIRLRDLYYDYTEEMHQAIRESDEKRKNASLPHFTGVVDGEQNRDEAHSYASHAHRPMATYQEDPKQKKAILNRLARASGHIDHIKRMVENGDDASDILIQLAAVRSAINNTGKVILHDHINECITAAVEDGDYETVNRMEEAIKFFIK